MTSINGLKEVQESQIDTFLIRRGTVIEYRAHWSEKFQRAIITSVDEDMIQFIDVMKKEKGIIAEELSNKTFEINILLY